MNIKTISILVKKHYTMILSLSFSIFYKKQPLEPLKTTMLKHK